MNVSKQLINLVGILIAVVVVVAGVALIAMPMFSQAQATDSNTRTVAQTNSVYDVQVAQLTAANERITEIDAELASLRTQIAAAPQLDDVFEIINAAAEATTVTIDSVTVADPEAWTVLAAVADATGTGTTTVVEEEAPVAEATDVATDTDAEADPAPVEPPVDPSASPQMQASVTIVVAATDAATAMVFVDALRVGPRLILPIDSTFADGTLTVQALTFIRTETAQ